MHIRHSRLSSYDKAVGCNHFPVGQARCDGRTTRMSDRPSHCTSFPISDPVLHEEDNRLYWCGLYGMNTLAIDRLIQFGRSWAYAPQLTINSPGAVSQGYDRSRRCYQLEKTSNTPTSIDFVLSGSQDSPIFNPAIYVKNWNAESARIMIDGKNISEKETGICHKLEGTDLVIFLWMKSNAKMNVRIIPE
jgi:hypothetical protein